MSPPAAGRNTGNKFGSWLNAAVLVFALTACAVLLVIVGARLAVRKDVTATRQHELSARSGEAIKRLDRTLTLAIAADMGSLDKATRQRTEDVLMKFAAASPARLKVQLIDTTRSEGVVQYDQLLQSLAEKDKPQIESAARLMAQSAAKAETLAGDLRTYQERMLKLKDQPEVNPTFLTTKAAQLRVLADDLSKGARGAAAQLAQNDAMLPLPPIDKALLEFSKPVNDTAGELSELHRLFSERRTTAGLAEPEKAVATELLAGLPELRDTSARLAGDLGGLAQNMPRLLKVARALQSRRAALLIDEGAVSGSGQGMLAINVDAVLAVGEGNSDLRGRTEDLITGAIVRMTSGVRPTVCLVHGAPVRLAPEFAGFQKVREELSMQGIDIVEWAVALDRQMPASVAGRDPARPVVFVTVTATGKVQGREAGIVAFRDALNGLVGSGRNVLLSVNLSETPMNGAKDPFVECVETLGVAVDSGRPVLHEAQSGSRRVVSPFTEVVSPRGAHPIGAALDGLRVRMMFALNIDLSGAKPGVIATPIMVVPSGPGVWAESEWREFYSGIQQVKGEYTQIANPPAKDSSRDDAGTSAGWTLAAALERMEPGLPRQRVVVVGNNGWFVDPLTAQMKAVDGKEVAAWPGNLQLLLSGVQWLAYQDDQIGRGATASAAAYVPELSPAQLGWLRALLIGVLPALVLVLGVLYRLVRP